LKLKSTIEDSQNYIGNQNPRLLPNLNMSDSFGRSTFPTFLDVRIIHVEAAKLITKFSCTFVCSTCPGGKTAFRIIESGLWYPEPGEENGFSQTIYTEPSSHHTFCKNKPLRDFLAETTGKLFGKNLPPRKNSILSNNVALPIIVSVDQQNKQKYFATPLSWIHLKRAADPQVVKSLYLGDVASLLRLIGVIDKDLEARIKVVQDKSPEFFPFF
jgi:hypothetical protein